MQGSTGEERSYIESGSQDALFRVVALSAHDGIVIIDEESTILFANPSVELIFGYEPGWLVGKNLTLLMPDYLRHLHEAALERYLATGEKHLHWGGTELQGLHRNGHEVPLEVSFGETIENGRHIFTGVIRDVSERRRTERRWEAQYAIARILATGDDLEQVAADILHTICNCLDWQVGIFWRPDEEGNLIARSYWCDQALDVDSFLRATQAKPMAPGIGVPGRVAADEQPTWLTDLDLDDNFPRRSFAREAGLHAVIAFPIRMSSELVGVMEFYSPEIREPDPALLNLMKSTAVQVGQFVERRRAQLELKELNTELEQRVALRTAQLEKSTEELESFVYSVSHDLRAPLRGIDGFSQLLLDDYAARLGPSANDYLLRIRRAAGRMGNLIDDLLDLSRIAKSEVKRERVDLSELAAGLMRELSERHPERSVQAVIQPGLVATGDPQLLEIVMENLLSNSWKFTVHKEQPRIEFGAERREGENVFFVRDNGAGFDMAFAAKLFRPFQRLHSPNQFEGTGIGLTTVKRIIERHDGEIWAKGEVDGGAVFYFTLGRAGTPEPTEGAAA
ncbi:MAG TPA: PAS domain S-box protein [Trueperaceae bacterium]